MGTTNILKVAYAAFRELPFPEFPHNEVLAEWLADLAEIDGYYAGLAESALSGRCLEHELIELGSLNQRLAAINEEDLDKEDKKIYYECQAYLRALTGLRDALMQFQAQCRCHSD
jgi:hypothetical protein